MNWLDWVFIGLVLWLGLFALLNLWFPKPKTLWKRGRWALIFEPVDLWIGGYYDRDDRRLFLVVLPAFPVRYQRKDVGRL